MNQLPTIKKRGSIGEEQMTPDVIKYLAPELMTEEGGKKVMDKLKAAQSVKHGLEMSLHGISSKIPGSTTSARVKHADVLVKKIAQKRMQGRDYSLDDVNDAIGGRIVVPNISQEKTAIKEIREAARQGDFKILKEQSVDKDTYHAYHFDIEKKLSGGKTVRGEIQIHTPQSELEATSNHDLRAVYGEKPPEQVEAIRDQQADLAKEVPNGKAKQLSKTIVDARKENNDKPLPPILVNHALHQAANG